MVAETIARLSQADCADHLAFDRQIDIATIDMGLHGIVRAALRTNVLGGVGSSGSGILVVCSSVQTVLQFVDIYATRRFLLLPGQFHRGH